jgi:hypothetical protein
MPKAKIFEIDGVRDTFTGHCTTWNVTPSTVYRRMKRYGIDVVKAIKMLHYDKRLNVEKQGRPTKEYEYTGVPFTAQNTAKKVEPGDKHSMNEWSEVLGIKVQTLHNRMHRFKDFNRTINQPLDLKISSGINQYLNWEKGETQKNDKFKGLAWDSYVEDTGTNEVK